MNGIAGLALVVVSSAASAQTASQITPPSFAPKLERGGGLVIAGSGGLAAPAGAEKLFVKLAGVSVKDGLPELSAATPRLEARLAGKGVSGAEVRAAARDLEAAYAAAGYVLVWVVLPPQKLNDGTRLKLVVIDGFIERIETKGIPERVRQRIATRVGPLTGRRGRSGNFNSEVAFDAQDEKLSLFVADVPIPLSQDKLRIVRFGNDGDVLTPRGRLRLDGLRSGEAMFMSIGRYRGGLPYRGNLTQQLFSRSEYI